MLLSSQHFACRPRGVGGHRCPGLLDLRAGVPLGGAHTAPHRPGDTLGDTLSPM